MPPFRHHDGGGSRATAVDAAGWIQPRRGGPPHQQRLPSQPEDPWLMVLEASTVSLRRNGSGDRASSSSTPMQELDVSLLFLTEMEATLRGIPQQYWDEPPQIQPPAWEAFQQDQASQPRENRQQEQQDPFSMAAGGGGVQFPPRPSSSSRSSHQQQPMSNNIRNANPFASFADDDDDDDDDDDETAQPEDSDDNEAGDVPTLHRNRQRAAAPPTRPPVFLDIRRLLIRILTSQSEIYAAKATLLRQTHCWQSGASQYTYCLQRIHGAILLADSEISRFWVENEQDVHPSVAASNKMMLRELEKDADICAVAVHFLSAERDRFLSAAQQHEAYLVRKLAPQWESRDEVRTRLGDAFWTNNPNPKRDYARMREQAEQQLKDLRRALECLENVDTTEVELGSRRLQDRVKGRSADQPDEATSSSSNPEPLASQRYNEQRPTDTSRRVSWQDYPDPTEFGWIFTGSWEVTEFFVKLEDGSNNGVVLLDWYFTTGTVKTSLDHPVQGKTQLFAAKVDPTTYREILTNPRAHTGQRYHRRPRPSNNDGRGGRNRRPLRHRGRGQPSSGRN